MSDIIDAMKEVVKMAKELNRTCYLYDVKGEYPFRASYQCWNDWLFKAYPGGRKQLSIRGKALLTPEELEVLK